MNDYIYVTTLLPMLFLIPTETQKDYILTIKQRMLCKMLEELPAKCYEAVCFEFERKKAIVYEEIEFFKQADGRYIYNGDFVSREFLEKKFENLPYRIKMTVHVRKENLKTDE